MNNNQDITFLGTTTGRHQCRFGIRYADRRSHLYVIGRTGTGKTTLLKNLVLQDIQAGRGVMLIDPHGDLVSSVAEQVPIHRQADMVYLDAPDPRQPYGYNPLRKVRGDKRSLAASGILEVFQKLWSDAWGQRMEHILRNAILALLEQNDATLESILWLLRDKSYRRQVVSTLENPAVRDFWSKEYEHYSYRLRADAIVPIQNKVGAFLADPVIRRILTAPEKPLSFRRLMDQGAVVLVNLAKGKLGADSSHLLGALLVTTVGLAAYSRADIPEEQRADYSVVIDEFQNFTTKSIADMTSELRKFRVHMVLANQYVSQLDRDIRDSILANAGSLVSFRVGPDDARLMEKEFEPQFSRADLLNLPNFHIYLKLMIDGAPSRPFSAATLAPGSVMG